MNNRALLIIDMINDLIKNPSNALYCPHTRQTVENIVSMIDFAHKNQWKVVFVQDAHRIGDKDFTVRPVHAIRDTWGAGLIDELRELRQKSDYEVLKRRHSGFSYTDLDLYLREERIDEVVLTGVWTNVAVRNTASDAFYQFYRVIVVSDCCQSQTQEMHESGLHDLSMFAQLTLLTTLTRSGT
ncbi:MAG: cysteine hydrolase [Firmicutes bacterium]|nr:cysteine hydrolase [Bacillota bacterium]